MQRAVLNHFEQFAAALPAAAGLSRPRAAERCDGVDSKKRTIWFSLFTRAELRRVSLLGFIRDAPFETAIGRAAPTNIAVHVGVCWRRMSGKSSEAEIEGEIEALKSAQALTRDEWRESEGDFDLAERRARARLWRSWRRPLLGY